MKTVTLVYKIRRAWQYSCAGIGGATREYLRRQRLVRRGKEPQKVAGRVFPQWPVPQPLDPLPTRVAVIASPSIEMGFSYEWQQVPLSITKWQSELDDSLDLLLVTSSAVSMRIWEDVPAILARCTQLSLPSVLWLDDSTVSIDEKLRTQFMAVVNLPPAVQPMVHNPRVITVNGKTLKRKNATPIKKIEGLPCKERLSAYRMYKYFVDSTKQAGGSPSRRHMEINACDGLVCESPAPDGNNDIDRMRQAYVARQNYWLSNTYRHRANEIIKALGNQNAQHSQISVAPMVSTVRPEQLVHVIEYLAAQRGVDLQPIISTHGFEAPESVRNLARDLNLEIIWLEQDSHFSLGSIYNQMIARADASYIAKMDDDDFYDATYLLDSVLAHRYSEAEIVGKRSTFVYLESLDSTLLCFEADENKFVHEVAGPTLLCSRDFADEIKFADISTGEDSDFLRRASQKGAAIYAGSRFGFVRTRSSTSHTWAVDNSVFTANGRQIHAGGPSKLELPGHFGVLGSLSQ